jgi:hypothetical protein
MARRITYRLLSLSSLIVLVLATFLAFFFVWVLAPIAVNCVFYLAFFINEERSNLGRERRRQRRERRYRLRREAHARREGLAAAPVRVEAEKVRP